MSRYVTRIWTTSLLLLAVTGNALAEEAPPPGQVRIESVSYNGPGCPIGSAVASLAPDGRALTLLFDSFTATTGGGVTRDYKACTIDLRMQVPAGWSFGLFKTHIRGYANIAASSIGTQHSRYTFGSQRLAVSSRQIAGPFANDYQHDQTVPLPNLVYSPCNGGRSLSILTSLEVNGNASLMTVDSVDGELKQTYGLSWKRCSGTQLIGPNPVTPNFSQARAIDADTGRDVALVQAYAPEVRVGVHVAACDLNGDGYADLVTGTKQGVAPHVRVFDGKTGAQLSHALGSFYAYAQAFTGGVFVGCGDVDGDGRDDLITGAGPGAGPHVIAFSGRTGGQLKSFFAFDQAFRGGVSVAAADINGDRVSDIIVGAGPGGGPHVKVFDGRTQAELRSFFAFDQGFRGGVRVAGGDINNDGMGDIIVGAGPGAGPHVKAFDGRTQRELHSFFAYDERFRGGVNVASADIDADGVNDIIVGALKGGGPHVRVISGLTGLSLEGWNGSFWGFAQSFTYGVEVAAAPASSRHTASVRRFFVGPSAGTASPR